MTTPIRFESLVVQTASERQEYRFDGDITSVVGPVGSGKTSLLETLKYGIGGGAALSSTVKQSVRSLVVRVQFPTQTLLFARRIGSPTIDVHAADGVLLETISARNKSRVERAGQFLLDASGLPRRTMTRRGGQPGGRTENISFFDVYRYCYLSQSEIDRSVVRNDDTFLERRRKAVFEMLFGLTDEETASADRVMGEAAERLAEARQEETLVRRFLEQGGGATETELREERVGVTAELEASREQLAGLREDMRRVTVDESSRQARVAQMARRVREVHESAAILESQMREHTTGIAQYEVQLDRLRRTTAARQLIDTIEFSRCPRCMQALTDRPVQPGDCMLCLQPEPARRQIGDLATGTPDGQLGFGDLAINDERRRIEAVRNEVLELAEGDRRELAEVRGEQRALEVTLREMLTDLDRRTAEYVSPRYEAISELSGRVAGAEKRIESIDESLTYWDRLRQLASRVATLEATFAEAKADAESARAALEARRSIVVELSDAFDDQISRLEPPWYDGARIDLKTYLPILNGADFETLSGGEKTMVNVAYHLALLTVALARRDTLLPSLLLIDTPRKNLGAGYDQTYAERIYRQIRALADAHPGRFQMIVCDNDPPAVPLPRSSQLDLNYDSPFVPGVDHPGPNVVPVPGGQETDK